MSNDFPFVIWGKVGVIYSQISSVGGRRKEKEPNESKMHLSMDESLENTFSRNNNNINDRNGESNKEEFHNNYYGHIMNAISDERSA